MEIAIADLNKRDKRFYINKNEDIMYDTIMRAKSSVPSNKYMTGVIDGYKKYYVNKQKECVDQYTALQQLSDYIDHVTSEEDITEQMLRESISDQKDIMRTMREIKTSLDRFNTLLE